MGKKNNKVVDSITISEKIQDSTRDIFVALSILLLIILPTTYIGIRLFQPMTIPGYEQTTFSEYLVGQFSNHVDMDLQTEAFLEVLVSPYAAVVDVSSELFPQLKNNGGPSISLKEVPDSWWNAIQKRCIFWLERARNDYE